MTAFIVAMLCLILVFVALAYWRSDGQEDVKQMRHEVEALPAWQKEFIESLADSVATAYNRSRQRLQTARENLRQLKEEALEGFNGILLLGVAWQLWRFKKNYRKWREVHWLP